MTAVAILLAAGASRRFGAADKLSELVGGRPLLRVSAEALAQSGAERLVAVLRTPAQACFLPAGYEVTFCEGELAQSLQAGLGVAVDLGATRVLIALADMPHVPAPHFHKLLSETRVPNATSGPDGPMVPACFPESWFDRLDELKGDEGAARVLRGAAVKLFSLPQEALKDYDTQADFEGAKLR